EDEFIPAKDACWSPDSARVAFSSDLRGFFNIGIYEVATGTITWVTEGKGDKEQPAWSPDGQRLAYVLSDGPATWLAVLDLETGSTATYQIEPGVHHHPRFTPDGTGLVFVFDNPRHPSDLWLLSLRPFEGTQGRLRSEQALAGGSWRQLTYSLPPALRDAPFVMPSIVWYPGLDGEKVPALLYRPRQVEGKPPAVIYVHGGPNWLIQITWDPLVQHMVSRGWIVLAPNYRGSTGYGREWQLANRFDLGGGDTRDVVAGADYLVREGLADPKRIAVTGRSWGGYLTMTCLTQYPDRWAGGSAVVPFLNWFTAHANSRGDLQHWDLENFGDPEKNRDLYYERSPFFFLDRVTAPVQLICGAHDPRCPASESIQAHEVLAAQGKPCDLVLYPDEGHVFLKIENVVDAKRRQVEFLARVLE
ncbi:MAG: S9 family peptidase, partial [Anaerolineae bacterium]|nr:S9 family peptidase [Anaerolineae bacterium]